jgi:5'-3' exoribonuclease 1
MNGIIHNCAKAFDPEKEGGQRTEEEIFVAIFAYIQTLFDIIKPQKLFFLAVDGVAPRAKMNQQRSRRFRAAKEAEEEAAKEAKRMAEKGLKRPENAEPRFDGNCITPGTEFMDRMAKHLRYFIAKRISEESSWQGITVLFSGPEVPGEGEHKIMEYIRSSKAQPGYNPNLRHCLYGLDADLILLGLLSHEPHFALLREEVLFGPASRKARTLAQTKFFLLYLGLLRDYIDEEFRAFYSASNKSLPESSGRQVDRTVLPFPQYNLERIVDDFVLMTVFVGNDFLPGLPYLHINEDAIGLMFDAYKQMYLRSGGQYMNSAGTVDWRQCALFLRELVHIEKGHFERSGARHLSPPKAHVISERQKTLYELVRKNLLLNEKVDRYQQPGGIAIDSQDKKFLWKLALDFGLTFGLDDHRQFTLAKGYGGSSSGDFSETEEDRTLPFKVKPEMLAKYDGMPVKGNAAAECGEEELEQAAFTEWKRVTYREKLGFDFKRDPGALAPLLRAYATGIQWNMYYYYRGIVDWAWFFPYHYGPYLSDVAEFLGGCFECPPFEMGTPYSPLQQLLGVLPAASRAHVPKPMAELMCDPHSPIIDFYPVDFETDANGKKAPWEAVVLIPFIDEQRLLVAIEGVMGELRAEEVERNRFGSTLMLSYSPRAVELAPPPKSRYPVVHQCRCAILEYDLPVMDVEHYFKPELCRGLLPVPGFPTLTNLAHRSRLDRVGIDIFGGKQPSSCLSLVLTPDESQSRYATGKESMEALARRLVGQRVFVSWPFLGEARVLRLTDGLFTYYANRKEPLDEVRRREHARASSALTEHCLKMQAIDLGAVEVVVWVAPLLGLKQDSSGALVKRFSESGSAVPHPLQLLLAPEDCLEDPRWREQGPLAVEEEFPLGSKCVYVGASPQYFGALAEVTGHGGGLVNLRLQVQAQPSLRSLAQSLSAAEPYYPARVVGHQLNLSPVLLNRIVGLFYLFFGDDMDKASNIGLCLKFENRSLKVAEYTRRAGNGDWEYSQAAVALIRDYIAAFPALFDSLRQARIASKAQAADLFGPGVAGPRDLAKVLEPIRAWLKARLAGLQEIPIDTQLLSPAAVAKVFAHQQQQQQQPGSATTLVDVKRVPATDLKHEGMAQFVSNPADGSGSAFSLGDRVRYLGTGAAGIPFGVTGTLIGLDGPSSGTDHLAHLLLDEPLLMGASKSSLGGRCPPNHGISVPKRYLLNLNRAGGGAVESVSTGMAALKLSKQQPKAPLPKQAVPRQLHERPTLAVTPKQNEPAMPQALASLFQAASLKPVVHTRYEQQTVKGQPKDSIASKLATAKANYEAVQRKTQTAAVHPKPTVVYSTKKGGAHPSKPVPAAETAVDVPTPKVSPPVFTTASSKKKLLKPNMTWSSSS